MGLYKVPFAYTGNGLVDLCALLGASGKPYGILGFINMQLSDFGDANEEVVKLRFSRGATTVGSGGSSVSPVNTMSGGSAAGFTARQADTTKASGGTIVEIGRHGWNVRMGHDKMFSEMEQLWLAAAERCVFELASAPADSLTIEGELLVQELG